MVGSRLQILQTLQRNGRETVESLARSLKLAPAAIRRHMDILQRGRFISFQEVKRPTGRRWHIIRQAPMPSGAVSTV